MDTQEMKDRLQAVINALIKDTPEEASKELHDVLAAKMRDRISPEEIVVDDGTGTVTDDETVGDHVVTDPPANPPAE